MGSGLSSSVPNATSIPIDVLTDKGLQKRLKQFDKAKTAADEAIALAGKAGDILRMRDDLVKEVAEQEAITAEVRDECERLITEAHASAKATVAKAQIKADKLTEASLESSVKAKKIAEDAQVAQKAAQEATASMEKMQRKLESDIVTLAERSAQVTEKETLLLKEKSKLETVFEQIRSTLG